MLRILAALCRDKLFLHRAGSSNGDIVCGRCRLLCRSTTPVNGARYASLLSGTQCLTSSRITDPRGKGNRVFRGTNANCSSVIGNRNHATDIGHLDLFHILRCDTKTTSLSIPRGHNASEISSGGRPIGCDHRFSGFSQTQTFCHARTHHIVLISRQSHSSQNTNDRHNDHQFDKGETLLHVTCDGTTVHSLTPGWLVVTPGNLPGARYLPQHLCHPFAGPSTDRTRHLRSLQRYTM